MASTTMPTPSFSDTLPSPTDDGNTGSQLMQRGASYFFGFLITFVVLLLVFLCCGVGSRRRYMSRRALMAGSEWDQHDAPLVEPTFYEPRLEKGGLDWSGIAPLSASVVRKPSSPARPPALPSNTSLTFLINLIRPFFHKLSQTPDMSPLACEEAPPEALLVAVMIAMPSANPHNSRQNDSNDMTQFEIGTTHIPWETEVES